MGKIYKFISAFTRNHPRVELFLTGPASDKGALLMHRNHNIKSALHDATHEHLQTVLDTEQLSLLPLRRLLYDR